MSPAVYCLLCPRIAWQILELVLFTELFCLWLHHAPPLPGLCVAENTGKATVG